MHIHIPLICKLCLKALVLDVIEVKATYMTCGIHLSGPTQGLMTRRSRYSPNEKFLAANA